ncbi:hypothetical protein GUITHDRAFT_154969, partial [Guillardia theta CCMP2712]
MFWAAALASVGLLVLITCSSTRRSVLKENLWTAALRSKQHIAHHNVGLATTLREACPEDTPGCRRSHMSQKGIYKFSDAGWHQVLTQPRNYVYDYFTDMSSQADGLDKMVHYVKNSQKLLTAQVHGNGCHSAQGPCTASQNRT